MTINTPDQAVECVDGRVGYSGSAHCSTQLLCRTEQTCDVLMGIYESAQVEMRPVGSTIWQDAVATVRARDSSGVVITAWNPGSDRPSLAENKQANDLLLKRLQQYCNDIWEADGFSPDRVHREPGFIAWGMPAASGAAHCPGVWAVGHLLF